MGVDRGSKSTASSSPHISLGSLPLFTPHVSRLHSFQNFHLPPLVPLPPPIFPELYRTCGGGGGREEGGPNLLPPVSVLHPVFLGFLPLQLSSKVVYPLLCLPLLFLLELPPPAHLAPPPPLIVPGSHGPVPIAKLHTSKWPEY